MIRISLSIAFCGVTTLAFGLAVYVGLQGHFIAALCLWGAGNLALPLALGEREDAP